MTEIYSAITEALNIHLNIGQSTMVNTSAVFVSVQTLSADSLSNRAISQVGNARIQMPSTVTLDNSTHGSIRLRVSDQNILHLTFLKL